MTAQPRAITATWNDVFLIDGTRTPFVDYNGALSGVSPIDLAIKAGKSALEKTGVPASDVGTVICGNMAQASFDAYMLPRHVALYSGCAIETPAHLVQRVCGTGVEVMSQAADALELGRAEVALCVGTESMSRNPVASYTSRSGFRMGQVEFKDFLWEALLDPSANVTMGDTAENLARRYQITRPEVDDFASRSFARAVKAEEEGFLAGEITPVTNETFTREGLNPRGIKLSTKEPAVTRDSHVRPSSVEALAKIRPAFGGVQTGGNSSAVVDGAAASVLASRSYVKKNGLKPLSRVVACASVGVPPRSWALALCPPFRPCSQKPG